MDRIIFEEIKLDLDAETLAQFAQKSSRKIDYSKYIPAVQEVARPKALLVRVHAKVLSATETEIEGHVFTSKIMADKLKGQDEVLLFAATAGNEISDTDRISSASIKNMIAGAVLITSLKEVYKKAAACLGSENLATLNPGSLPDWNIDNNKALCDIIGNVSEIGISLTDKGYMQPWNSSSGIIFQSSSSYQNCTLCKNIGCIGRRAEFDSKEYERLFGEE